MKLKVNKKILIAVGVVLLVGGIVGSIVIVKGNFDKMKEKYETQVSGLNGTIDALNQELDEIGPITSTYQLKIDVKSGAQISAEDFEPVDIPAKYTYDEDLRPDGYVTDLSTIENMRYKTNLSAGTIITPALTYDDYLTKDLRFLDVTFDELPIGLEVGDYIDVRVRYAGGQDMIAMKHKEVVTVYNTNTVRLLVSEIDLHTYRSIQTDKSYYDGLELYGVLYLDAGVQDPSIIYYPLRLDVLSTIVQDPNIADEFDISEYQWYNRDLLESQLISNMQAKGNEYYGEIVEYLQNNRQKAHQQFLAAQQAYAEAQQNNGEYNSAASESAVINDASEVYNN